jgi:hypothetical protein
MRHADADDDVRHLNKEGNWLIGVFVTPLILLRFSARKKLKQTVKIAVA